MKTVIVNVTRQNIIDGKNNFSSSLRCPIARALKEINEYSSCGWYFARLGHVHFKLPKKAVEFEERLLNGKTVKPFKFKVRY